MRRPSEGTMIAYIILAVAVLCAFLLFFQVRPANAHSWYEPSCCSTIDCKPVDDGIVEERADGIHVKGYGVLSHSDPRVRWSRDDQDHLCVQQSGQRKLLCVYRKPKGY